MAAAPALAAECRLGPPPHEKGPLVFLNYDQLELDAAYDQDAYELNVARIRVCAGLQTATSRAPLR